MIYLDKLGKEVTIGEKVIVTMGNISVVRSVSSIGTFTHCSDVKVGVVDYNLPNDVETYYKGTDTVKYERAF